MNAFRFAGSDEFAALGGTASSRRLDMTYALTRLVMNEMRDPLTLARGYGEMLSRDGNKGSNARMLSVMGGIDRIGALLTCVNSMFDTPMLHTRHAEVEPILSVATQFVRLTHHPTPDIVVELDREIPPVAMPSIDVQHLVLAMLMSACEAARPAPRILVAAQTAYAPQEGGEMLEISVTYPVRTAGDNGIDSPGRRSGRHRSERNRWLGFSICRDIVKPAGGRVLIDSVGVDRRKTTAIVPVASDFAENGGVPATSEDFESAVSID